MFRKQIVIPNQEVECPFNDKRCVFMCPPIQAFYSYQLGLLSKTNKTYHKGPDYVRTSILTVCQNGFQFFTVKKDLQGGNPLFGRGFIFYMTSEKNFKRKRKTLKRNKAVHGIQPLSMSGLWKLYHGPLSIRT